jgi:hypothetical protein
MNSATPEGQYYAITCDGININDSVNSDQLYDGMQVVAYYSDPSDEFEYSGRIWHRPIVPSAKSSWFLTIDRDTFRRIR